MGVDLDLAAPVSSLRVAERQVIEIARALVGDARCLILDEPTAALSHQEVERLFAFIGRLRERGVAIIYITHRLDEVVRIADRVQILRDGSSVLEGLVSDYQRDDLVTAMVGKAIGAVERPAPLETEPTETLLAFEAAASGGVPRPRPDDRERRGRRACTGRSARARPRSPRSRSASAS